MAFIIGVPSGEILNCSKNDIYDLYIVRYINRVNYYKGIHIDNYIFKDKNRYDIINIIYDSIKIGKKIHHNKYGEGVIYGIIGDDWIIHFNDDKKLVLSNKIIVSSLNIKIL